MSKYLLFFILLATALLLPTSSHAQAVLQGAPCGAGGLTGITPAGVPVTCQGSPLVWTPPGGPGGSSASVANAVTASPNCSPSNPLCFQTVSNVQTALTAQWTQGGSGGSTATLITTSDNDTGAQFLQVSTPTSNFGSYFTNSTSLAYSSIMAAFKVSGTPVLGTCVGTNDIAATATTITQAITPTGGSGHLIFAFARTGTATTITFSDNSGSNTWANVLAAPVGPGGTGAAPVTQMGYVLSAVGGSYTITATFGASAAFRSIFACEVSGISTSNALDASVGQFINSAVSTFIATDPITTTANDFVVQAGSVAGTSNTFSAGKIGTSATVTTLSTDPPFASTAIGNKVVLTTNCASANGYINCTQAAPNNTKISIVNGPHSVTLTALPVLAPASTGTNFTGWFLWGTDDGAQLTAAFQKAITIPGSTLYLPCGSSMIGQQPFLVPAATFPVYNPNIVGCGSNGTVLVPTMDFNFAGASGGFIYSNTNTNITQFGNFFQTPFIYAQLSGFTVWGGGIDGGNVTTGLPIFNAYLSKMYDVNVTGWLSAAGSGINTIPVVSGKSLKLDHMAGWGAGTQGVVCLGDQFPSDEPSTITNSFFGSQGVLPAGMGIQNNGCNLHTSGNTFNSGANSVTGTVSAYGCVNTSGFWASEKDLCAGLSATGGIIDLKNTQTSFFKTIGVIVAGGAVKAINSQVDKLTMTSGSFIDEGGNYSCNNHTGFTSCATPFTITPWSQTSETHSITGGVLIGSGSITGTACATGNFALTSGWATSAIASVDANGDSHRCHVNITGAAGTIGPVLTWTYPVPYVVAPGSCVVVGNFGTLTSGASTSKTTTACAITFVGTPSAQTYSLDIEVGP